MNSDNNKRIAKNTTLLYLRMILTMLVSLFTVRVVLDTLGVVDYGIFNVVGGIVTMLSFLSGTMASASQRFLAFEIGRNDDFRLKKTFSTTVIIYGIIAFFIFIIAETIGLWFLNNKMIIPTERFEAARWVYHFSVFSFITTVMTIPYQAVIIAREKMKVYALMSIIEVSLKLLIVYLLVLFSFDKLKLYAFLLFGSTTIITFIYRFYCKRSFQEANFKFHKDKLMFNEILNYAGWNMIGAVANILRSSGVNILLNMFYGPVINASRGLAFQISSAINAFIINFYVAVRPQITKAYSSGDFKYFKTLVFQSSKFSYFFLLFLTMPLIIEIEFILEIWLKEFPPNVILFTRLMIIGLMIETMNNQLVAALQAAGKIKLYQTVVSSILISILPISYLFFYLGFPPEVTFYVSIAVIIVCFVPQLLIVRKIIGFSISSYLKNVTFIMLTVTIASFLLPLFVHFNMVISFKRFLIVILCGIVSSLSSVYFLGLSKSEREMIKSYINKMIKNIKL
jgi:O-antigen/teichoic acid export membrane protein